MAAPARRCRRRLRCAAACAWSGLAAAHNWPRVRLSRAMGNQKNKNRTASGGEMKTAGKRKRGKDTRVESSRGSDEDAPSRQVANKRSEGRTSGRAGKKREAEEVAQRKAEEDKRCLQRRVARAQSRDRRYEVHVYMTKKLGSLSTMPKDDSPHLNSGRRAGVLTYKEKGMSSGGEGGAAGEVDDDSRPPPKVYTKLIRQIREVLPSTIDAVKAHCNDLPAGDLAEKDDNVALPVKIGWGKGTPLERLDEFMLGEESEHVDQERDPFKLWHPENGFFRSGEYKKGDKVEVYEFANPGEEAGDDDEREADWWEAEVRDARDGAPSEPGSVKIRYIGDQGDEEWRTNDTLIRHSGETELYRAYVFVNVSTRCVCVCVCVCVCCLSAGTTSSDRFLTCNCSL